MDLFKKYENYKFSPYPKNKILNWSTTDDEDRFLDNVEKKIDTETTDYYLKNPITYGFNNYGFRTPDDFNSEDEGNLFLGCSYTVGIGVHLENSWAYQVNQHVGGKFWNMSVAGSGIMCHFRLLFAFIDELKIKNVFHFGPKFERFEFFKNDEPYQLDGNWRSYKDYYSDDFTIPYLDFYVESISTPINADLVFATHLLAIENLCKIKGINYYYIQERPDENMEGLKARDLCHPPITWHKHLSDIFIKKYEEKDTNVQYFNRCRL
jgi:hypothetical protein